MARFQAFDVILSLSPSLRSRSVSSACRRRPLTSMDGSSRVMPFTQLYNVTGQPSMSVPLHWTSDGLPVEVMFSARFGEGGSLPTRGSARASQALGGRVRRPDAFLNQGPGRSSSASASRSHNSANFYLLDEDFCSAHLRIGIGIRDGSIATGDPKALHRAQDLRRPPRPLRRLGGEEGSFPKTPARSRDSGPFPSASTLYRFPRGQPPPPLRSRDSPFDGHSRPPCPRRPRFAASCLVRRRQAL
jgi:hypothetical protein